MEQYMQEIDAAVRGNAWILALTATLALPDMCAALESENGETTGSKYKAWVNKWIGEKYDRLDADELWKMRCSMLHQGRTKTASYDRVIFVAPLNGNVFHNNIINDALNLDLPTFCSDVMQAVRNWELTVQGNADYERNKESLIRWHPEGLSPYIAGAPVLS